MSRSFLKALLSERGRPIRPRRKGRAASALAAILAGSVAFSGYTPQARAGGSPYIDEAMQLMTDIRVWHRVKVGTSGYGYIGWELNNATYRVIRLRRQRADLAAQLAQARADYAEGFAQQEQALSELENEAIDVQAGLAESRRRHTGITTILFEANRGKVTYTNLFGRRVGVYLYTDTTYEDMREQAIAGGFVTEEEIEENEIRPGWYHSWLRSRLDSLLRDEEATQAELTAQAAEIDPTRDALLQPQRDIDDMEAELARLDREIAEGEADMAKWQTAADALRRGEVIGEDNQQVKFGTPADAGVLFGLSTLRWWSGAAVSGFDIGTGANAAEGTVWHGAVGGDVQIRPGLSVGLGVVGRHGDIDGIQGNHVEVNGLSVFARAAQSVGPNAFFDASAFYGYDWARFRAGFGALDTYGTNRFGVGGGFNVLHTFADVWRAEGRIGWDGKWAWRPASVDTTGFPFAAASPAFGRASLYGKLARRVGIGEIYGDAELRAVTNDTTIYNLDGAPIDAVLGGGLNIRMGEGMLLEGRGHAVVGRDNFQDYGGTLRFTIAY